MAPWLNGKPEASMLQTVICDLKSQQSRVRDGQDAHPIAFQG